MVVGAVTPTRGERNFFLEKCKYMVERQTQKVDYHVIIDYEPQTKDYDLVDRYEEGIENCLRRGCDLIFAFEDDDYYPEDYVEKMVMEWEKNGRPQLIGVMDTIYYNIVWQRYAIIERPHCSLFMSAFGRDVIYKGCNKKERYYDKWLWRNNNGVRVKMRNKPIGIKHGVGMVGGDGHKAGQLKIQDKEFGFLRNLVDERMMKFYEEIACRLR